MFQHRRVDRDPQRQLPHPLRTWPRAAAALYPGRAHATYKTPHVAIIGCSLISLVTTLFFGLLWGPMAAFGNVGFFSSLAMLPIYIATNVALFFFIRKNYASEFNWVLNALFPAIAIVVFVAALISDLYPFPAAPLNVFPYVTAAWILIGVAWMLFLRRRSPERVDLIGRVIFQETEAEPRDLGPDVGEPLVESPTRAWPKP